MSHVISMIERLGIQPEASGSVGLVMKLGTLAGVLMTFGLFFRGF